MIIRLILILAFCLALVDAKRSHLHSRLFDRQHIKPNKPKSNPNPSNTSVLLGNVVYVNQAATPGGNGQSWASAYSDLQEAIQSSSTNSEIWIATGTYYPGISSSPSTTDTFTISKNNLKIYGGFAGTETNINQRNIKQNPTILSGQISTSTNAAHVVTVTALNSAIDGLTVTAGDCSGGEDGTKRCTDCFGGGIIFKNPLTTHNPAIDSEDDASARINSNNNNNNDTTDIKDLRRDEFIIGADVKYSLELSNVTVSNNKALLGGGIFAYADVVLTITDCEITDNEAVESSYHVSGGAGIYASMNAQLTIRQTTFANNVAHHRGAAIYGDYGVDMEIVGANFLSNSVTNGHGGAIYITDRASNGDTTALSLIGSTLDGNSATGYGGAVFIYSNVVALIQGNTFQSNKAGVSGGALTLYDCLTGDLCNQEMANTYVNNQAKNFTDCFDTDFPELKEHKKTNFDWYLSSLYSNYDSSEEPSQRPNIIYVDNSKTTSGNGFSWANAVKTVQEGIDLATQYGASNYEVWVRGGTGSNYVPTKLTTEYSWNTIYYNAQKSKVVTVDANVWLFGGFAGTETLRSQRNFYTNPTRISGLVDENTNTMTYQVVNMKFMSVIDGFIVSDGYGYSVMNTPRKVRDKNLTVSEIEGIIAKKRHKLRTVNSYYYDNYGNVGDSSSSNIQLHNKAPMRGNGIFANATCTVRNTLIVNNFGTTGAGLYVLHNPVTATNVAFIRNGASSRGGAVQQDVQGTLTCDKCYFAENQSTGKGGAIYLDYGAKLTLKGDSSSNSCNFVNNTADDGGGALGVDGTSTVVIECSAIEFRSNYAFQDGGALYEGSYNAYGTANTISFYEDSNTEIIYEDNMCFEGMGVSKIFVWNYDSVSVPSGAQKKNETKKL